MMTDSNVIIEDRTLAGRTLRMGSIKKLKKWRWNWQEQKRQWTLQNPKRTPVSEVTERYNLWETRRLAKVSNTHNWSPQSRNLKEWEEKTLIIMVKNIFCNIRITWNRDKNLENFSWKNFICDPGKNKEKKITHKTYVKEFFRMKKIEGSLCRLKNHHV